MGDISDIFWQLESRLPTDFIPRDGEKSQNIFSPRKFKILQANYSTSTHYEKFGGEIMLLLKESKDNGVACAIGGECFLLFHFNEWRDRNVLELGSGVGIPGLFLSSLKMTFMNLTGVHARCNQTRVHLTDYDDDVLSSLSDSIKRHFSRDYLVEDRSEHSHKLAHDDSKNCNPGIEVNVSTLDWTKCDHDIHAPTLACDVIVGSELVYTPELACVADIIIHHMTHGCVKQAVIVHMPSRTGHDAFLDRLQCLCSQLGGDDETASDVAIEWQEDPVPSGLYDWATRVRRGWPSPEGGEGSNVLSMFDTPGVAIDARGSDSREECVVFPPVLSLVSGFHSTMAKINPSLSALTLPQCQDSDVSAASSGQMAQRWRSVLRSPPEAFSVLRIWRKGITPMGLDVFSHNRSGTDCDKTDISGEVVREDVSGIKHCGLRYRGTNSEKTCTKDDTRYASSDEIAMIHRPANISPPLGTSRNIVHSRLSIGTLNIHNARSNLAAFVDLFLERSLNVISLQECGDRTFREINRLLAPHGFTGVYSPAAYAGNALFTTLPLTRSYRLSSTRCCASGAEMRSAIVGELTLRLPIRTNASDMKGDSGCMDSVEECVRVSVAGMHLSHVHEKDRSEQLASFLDKVRTPCVVTGDLNALLRSDYSAEKWNHISTVRASNRWPLPQSRVMTHLTKGLRYRDCWRASHLQCDGNKDTNKPNSSRAVEGACCFASSPDPTCRFDTRIDWILLPPLEHCSDVITASGECVTVNMDQVCHCEGGYYVVKTALSDHNLVVANISLSVTKRNPEVVLR